MMKRHTRTEQLRHIEAWQRNGLTQHRHWQGEVIPTEITFKAL